MRSTPALKLSRRILTVGLVVAVCGVGALFYAPAASAVTYSNACVNSAVPTTAAQVDVTLTGDAPASVLPGASFQLTNISQTLALPGTVFVAGYNLGLLVVGLNTIPGSIKTVIEGTNTVEGTQTTPVTAISVTFTITDPDSVPGTGDETSTDGIVNVNYPNQTWTAGPAGTIEFREDTVTPLSTTVGGIVITEIIGGFLTVRFGCDPGTVGPGGLVGDIVLTDPAVSFASTTILGGGNNAPTADAGPDQSVASGASVNLDGTGSSDPDADALTYAWSQTGGTAVTLSGADTASPSFTAPTGPASLTFDLEVCDPSAACDTDTVAITVESPTYSNACVNSAVPTTAAQVDVTLTGDAPASVLPGASFQLTNISQTLALPGTVFVAGYNLGLLVVGLNTIPGSIKTVIEGTNTVEGTQTTPVTAISVTFTITDPDSVPGTGDETSTDGIVNVNYPNQTWTAGPAGTIEFREDTVTPLSTTVGGIVITEIIGGFLTVRFGCDPGTVGPGGLVGDIVLTDPAVSFASTTILGGGNNAPTADAGPDQSVASGASVNLDGTGSSDPDADALTYAWSQTGGTAVTLSGADTASPSFTAPTGPASLTFDLEVCDPSAACDTDTVAITVESPSDTTPPEVALVSVKVQGSQVTVHFTASDVDDPSSDLSVSCLLVGDGGGQCSDPFTASLPSGSYHLEIQATDPAGNASAVLDVPFTIKSRKIKA